MPILKRLPNYRAMVVPVTPKLMLLKDCYKYTGMEEKLFRKEAIKYGLTVYAKGPKKIWYKISELDEMLESFIIIKSQIKTPQ